MIIGDRRCAAPGAHTEISGTRHFTIDLWLPAVTAAPVVGENSIGMRLAWRSFQAAIKRSGRRKNQSKQTGFSITKPSLKKRIFRVDRCAF